MEKKYFCKYLPVEIGEGVKGVMLLKNNIPVPHKLLLCSRDIQVGDKIWNQLSGYGLVKEINNEEQYLGVKYDSEEFEVEEDLNFIVKVIGKISPEAIWVKEGDEFEEDEIDIVFLHIECYLPSDFKPTAEDYKVKIKCKCCNTFK